MDDQSNLFRYAVLAIAIYLSSVAVIALNYGELLQVVAFGLMTISATALYAFLGLWAAPKCLKHPIAFSFVLKYIAISAVIALPQAIVWGYAFFLSMAMRIAADGLTP